MRKAIFIALAAASVSLFAAPNTATTSSLATAILYRPITITPTGFLGLGSVLYFGEFITDGAKMTATLDNAGNFSHSSNVIPRNNIHANASFAVTSDAAITYRVVASPAATTGSVTIAPTATSNAPKFASLIEGPANSTVTVGGTLSVPANTYGFVSAPFSVTVTYN